MPVQSLDQEVPLEKEKATHFSVLVWRIPWTEEPGGLQPVARVARVSHNLAAKPPPHSLIYCIRMFFKKTLWQESYRNKKQTTKIRLSLKRVFSFPFFLPPPSFLFLCFFLPFFFFLLNIITITSFSGGSDGQESACKAGDPGLIPGSERSLGEENGTPLQCSCLENPMDRGSWRVTLQVVAESDTTELLTNRQTIIFNLCI